MPLIDFKKLDMLEARAAAMQGERDATIAQRDHLRDQSRLTLGALYARLAKVYRTVPDEAAQWLEVYSDDAMLVASLRRLDVERLVEDQERVARLSERINELSAQMAPLRALVTRLNAYVDVQREQTTIATIGVTQ